jgi:hypothetical protein
MIHEELKIPTFIAPGELIDKLTILWIKSAQITDLKKLANVNAERTILEDSLTEYVPTSEALTKLTHDLQEVNQALWIIEDDIRECEREKNFGPKFIELARAVYVTNDKRAQLKKEINLLLGSAIVEEKSYASY